jgi:hypothetical protein
MSLDPADQLDSARNAALQAVEDGNWELVVKCCLKAEIILATIPDSRIGNSSDLEWKREAISKLRKRAEEIVASGEQSCELDVCSVEYAGIRQGGCGCSD